MKLNTEPVAIAGLISAAGNVALAWGVDVSIEQLASVNVLYAAVSVVLCRQAVTPNANLGD